MCFFRATFAWENVVGAAAKVDELIKTIDISEKVASNEPNKDENKNKFLRNLTQGSVIGCSVN